MTLVAIATYQRPASLRTLLESLEKCTERAAFDVLIVDNDEAESARRVVEMSPLNPIYVVEPRPGIAAARNRAMDEILGYDAIVFVDDDEHVGPGWLDALVDHAQRTGTGAVTGPVLSILPNGAPRWVATGGFLQRPSWPDGTALSSAATNNTLLSTHAWREAGATRFDDSFSVTGGSDTKFFSELLSHGLKVEFCESAVVYEPVPQDRLTLKWLFRRAFRNGIVLARVWDAKHRPEKIFAKGVVMALGGAFEMIGSVIVGQGLRAGPFNRCVNGLGVISALFRVRVHEYKRNVLATSGSAD